MDVVRIALLGAGLIGRERAELITRHPRTQLADEARGDRLPPGEGELPLAALVGALPDDTPFVVEAPLGPRYAELDDADRARLLHRAAAPLLAVRFAG